MNPCFCGCSRCVLLHLLYGRQVRGKTSLMTRYCSKAKTADEVPDPYYGGPAGFDLVLDLLDDAATGLLAHIQQEQQATAKQ